MKTIRVTAMLVLGLAALGALALGCRPPETAPAVKPAPSTGSTESTASTDPKPGEERTFAGIVFVWIPAGSFIMGSPESEEDPAPSEIPQHKVTFAEGFWMGKYEVTQAEWKAVMGNNPSCCKGSDRLPVEMVSWDDCQAFIKKLNGKGEGTFRLPTEAEWEYACRAGSETAYCFGNDASDLGSYAWYTINSDGETHPVGGKRANDWGLYDTHGNVWEWCQDWRGPYSSAAATDPKGPSSGEYRVLRGGSWYNGAEGCRAASRNGLTPDRRDGGIGFRVVRTV